MTNRDYRAYIRDILDSIKDIEAFTKDATIDSFKKDRKTLYAVVRCIEVIGEASKKMPKSIKDKHQGIPWAQIAGMRNKMIHEYFGVDTNILWQTVKEDVPKLESLIQEIAKEFDID